MFVVLGLMLLYAYRSQTPSVFTVPMSAAIQDVQAGRVVSVTIAGEQGILELTNGSRERTTVPQPDEVFAKAVLDYNATHPQKVNLRYENANGPLQTVGPVLLSMLPILLIAALVFLVLRTQPRT